MNACMTVEKDTKSRMTGRILVLGFYIKINTFNVENNYWVLMVRTIDFTYTFENISYILNVVICIDTYKLLPTNAVSLFEHKIIY